MNISKSLPVTIACLAFSFYSLAQNHDHDGYYINLKNDTVSGIFIHFDESSISPSSVSFQANGTKEQTNLTPLNCRKFSVLHVGSYISFSGKRLTNPTDYRAGYSDTTSVYEDLSAFLRELFNGGLYRLYEFNNRQRSNFYVSKGEAPLLELYYKESVQNGEAIESQEFRRQLVSYFRDIVQENPDAMGYIQKTDYTSAGLISLFNKMVPGQSETHDKKKYPSEFFAGFGASSNSLSVYAGDGFNRPENEAADYPSQVSPLFEVGFRLFSQGNFGRPFLTFRADYYSFKHSHEFDDMVNAGYHTTTTFSSTVLSFPIGIGYKIVNTKNFSLDLSAGPNFSFYINNSEVKVNNSMIKIESDNPNRFGFSFFGELSLVLYNRVALFGGYYTPHSITSAELYNAKASSFMYGLRVRIF